MVNPATALILFFAAALLTAIIFNPKFGLKKLWSRGGSDKKKILIEDSLKFIYDFQLRQLPLGKKELKNALSINDSRLDELIQLLLKMNLIQLSEENITLTEEGNSYAVKIVRIHRLLEKYLAEETSVKEDYWHIVAEEREHSVSDVEAESLSARLGNPLTDPHGDPIPGADGNHFLPERISLVELEENIIGIISHIEDEPPEVYSKILQSGLHLGSIVKILSRNKNEFVMEANGKGVIIPSSLAANISITKSAGETMPGIRKLSEVNVDEEAYIAGISKAMRGQQRRRLLDFGFVPGTKIVPRLISLGGDPVAYEIRSTTVALRKQQAEQVFVTEIENGNLNG